MCSATSIGIGLPSPRRTATSRAGGLRTRARGMRRRLHDRDAAGGSPEGFRGAGRKTHRHRLRAGPSSPRRDHPTRGRAHRPGSGQPQHPRSRLTLRSVPAGGGMSSRFALRSSLHSHTRKRVEHCGDRNLGSNESLPKRPHPMEGGLPIRDQRLPRRKKRPSIPDSLALFR